MSLLDPSRALLRLTELQQGFTDAARLSLTLSDFADAIAIVTEVTIARPFGTQSQQLGRRDFAERRIKVFSAPLRVNRRPSAYGSRWNSFANVRISKRVGDEPDVLGHRSLQRRSRSAIPASSCRAETDISRSSIREARRWCFRPRRLSRGRGGGHRRSRRNCLLRRRDASADLASGGAPFHGGRDLFLARVFDPLAP